MSAARRIIALTGLIGSGKSTVADYLCRKYGCVPMKFAGPLKAMLRSLYVEAGWSEAMIDRKVEGDLKNQPCPLLRGRTPRHAMQTLGTEWGRTWIHPDLWIDVLVQRIASGSGFVVIDDCRFPNEAVAVRTVGGTLWRVSRPSTTVADGLAHESESVQAELVPDREILNVGPLQDLEAAVDEAFAIDFA